MGKVWEIWKMWYLENTKDIDRNKRESIVGGEKYKNL